VTDRLRQPRLCSLSRETSDSIVKQPSGFALNKARRRVLAARMPELCLSQDHPPQSEGAGKAGCRLAPAAPVREKKHGAGTTGTAETRRPSLRSGFNGLLRALLGEPGFLATVTRATRTRRRKLDTSVGVSGPHGLAVRATIVRRQSEQECCDLARPPLPASTFVTIAIRPSARGGMRGKMRLIWGEHKAEYFLRDNWTGVMGLNGLAKLVPTRTRILRVTGTRTRAERRD
jgi:hypothetical protein